MLSPDGEAIKEAERAFREMEHASPEFALVLLEVLVNYPRDEPDREGICKAASIILKQVLRRGWPMAREDVERESPEIPPEVKVQIAENLTEIMLDQEFSGVQRRVDTTCSVMAPCNAITSSLLTSCRID